MICIKCSKDTPDNELYCRHCGIKLDITFDQITGKLAKDIHIEKQQDTESFFRWIMLVLLFFFLAGWMFNKLWLGTPSPDLVPAYQPMIEVPPDWQPVHKPSIIRE